MHVGSVRHHDVVQFTDTGGENQSVTRVLRQEHSYIVWLKPWLNMSGQYPTVINRWALIFVIYIFYVATIQWGHDFERLTLLRHDASCLTTRDITKTLRYNSPLKYASRPNCKFSLSVSDAISTMANLPLVRRHQPVNIVLLILC